MTSLSFADLAVKLKGWGYKVSKDPKEQAVPGEIILKYDLDMEPEDISMSVYKVTHEIEMAWIELVPDAIAGNIAALMVHLGMQYSCESHFEIGRPKIDRGNGTTYVVKLSVSWVQWLTVQ